MLRKTKVLLVQPRGVQEGFTRGNTSLPPLGLLYIAAAIRNVADVRLVDADALSIDDRDVVAILDDWAPDLVGMTVSWLTLGVVCRFARRVKDATDARIILGGPLPSALPAEVLEHQEVDFAAIGDGEPIMQGLCRALETSRDPEAVEGVISRNSLANGLLCHSPPRADLGLVERPAWDMLPGFGSYRSQDSAQAPITIIEGQRGCPHACSFCSVPAISGRERRARAIDSLVEEIDYLTGDRGIRELSFVDPDFMVNPQHAMAVSEGMISLGRPISWFCNARAASVSESVARTMQAAGCHLVYLGAESGDPAVLARIHKRQTLGQIEDACMVLRNSRIEVSVGFIIGFPFDTDDSVRRTIEFAKRLKPARFQFSIFNWFPGISMEAQQGVMPIGLHPKAGNTRWLDWQKRAYEELGHN